MAQPKGRIAIYLVVFVVLLGGKLGYDEFDMRKRMGTLPEPATHAVDYAKDIQPILEETCYECHGPGKSRGELTFDTREGLLQGSENGMVVKVGNSKRSKLIHQIASPQDDLGMPPRGTRLPESDVALIMAWIDQGLAWGAVDESGSE